MEDSDDFTNVFFSEYIDESLAENYRSDEILFGVNQSQENYRNKSETFRCHATLRLMKTPCISTDGFYYEQTSLTQLKKVQASQFTVCEDLREQIIEFAKATLSSFKPLLNYPLLHPSCLKIIAECLSVLNLEHDLDFFMQIIQEISEDLLLDLQEKLAIFLGIDFWSLVRLAKCNPSYQTSISKILIFQINQAPSEAIYEIIVEMLDSYHIDSSVFDAASQIAEFCDSKRIALMVGKLKLMHWDTEELHKINNLEMLECKTKLLENCLLLASKLVKLLARTYIKYQFVMQPITPTSKIRLLELEIINCSFIINSSYTYCYSSETNPLREALIDMSNFPSDIRTVEECRKSIAIKLASHESLLEYGKNIKNSFHTNFVNDTQLSSNHKFYFSMDFIGGTIFKTDLNTGATFKITLNRSHIYGKWCRMSLKNTEVKFAIVDKHDNILTIDIHKDLATIRITSLPANKSRVTYIEYYDGFLYLIGAIISSNLLFVCRYSLNGDYWESLTPISYKLFNASYPFKNKLSFLCSYGLCADAELIDVLDLETLTWSQKRFKLPIFGNIIWVKNYKESSEIHFIQNRKVYSIELSSKNSAELSVLNKGEVRPERSLSAFVDDGKIYTITNCSSNLLAFISKISSN